jgi:hypothetical protein
MIFLHTHCSRFFVQELCSQETCDDNVDQNHKKSKFMSADCS